MLPTKGQIIPNKIDTWWVTVAQAQHSMDNDYYYAGILQWDIRCTEKGEEYGEFSWGILIKKDNEENYMSYLEELLHKAVERGVIMAYAINGSRVEMNTGHSIVTADTSGAIQELKELSPELFAEDEIVPPEEPSVEQPKRKRNTKTNR